MLRQGCTQRGPQTLDPIAVLGGADKHSPYLPAAPAARGAGTALDSADPKPAAAMPPGCPGDCGSPRCRQEPSGLLLTKCSLCSHPIDLFSFRLVYFVSIIVITLITQWEALRPATGSQWGAALLCTCWVASHQRAWRRMCQLVKPQAVVTNLCHGSGRGRANLLAQACAGSAYLHCLGQNSLEFSTPLFLGRSYDFFHLFFPPHSYQFFLLL